MLQQPTFKYLLHNLYIFFDDCCCCSKWKSEESAVYSLCLCHTQRHLLSAGRNIRLWDLDTREVLRVIVNFCGFETSVVYFGIAAVTCLLITSEENTVFDDADDDCVHHLDKRYTDKALTDCRSAVNWRLTIGRLSADTD